MAVAWCWGKQHLTVSGRRQAQRREFAAGGWGGQFYETKWGRRRKGVFCETNSAYKSRAGPRLAKEYLYFLSVRGKLRFKANLCL